MNTNFTPGMVVQSVLHCITKLKNNKQDGPYQVYIPINQNLEETYFPLSITLKDRLLQIEGVIDVIHYNDVTIQVRSAGWEKEYGR